MSGWSCFYCAFFCCSCFWHFGSSLLRCHQSARDFAVWCAALQRQRQIFGDFDALLPGLVGSARNRATLYQLRQFAKRIGLEREEKSYQRRQESQTSLRINPVGCAFGDGCLLLSRRSSGLCNKDHFTTQTTRKLYWTNGIQLCQPINNCKPAANTILATSRLTCETDRQTLCIDQWLWFANNDNPTNHRYRFSHQSYAAERLNGYKTQKKPYLNHYCMTITPLRQLCINFRQQSQHFKRHLKDRFVTIQRNQQSLQCKVKWTFV